MAIKEKLGSIFSKLKSKKLKAEQVDKIKKTKGKIFSLFDKNKFVDTNDESRVDTKILQNMSFAFHMSLTFNVILIVVILSLLPLKEKVPYFVHFMAKDEQIVYVEQYKQSKKAERNIKEYLSRDYVKKRESIDLVTEEDRWAYIQFISTEDMKTAFANEFNPDKNSKSIYKYAIDNNMLRTIRIISSSVLNDNQYQVEFEIIQSIRTNGVVVSTTIAIATVSFVENTDQFKGYDYLNNPFGYLVSDYSIGIKEQRDNRVDNKIPQTIGKAKNEDTPKDNNSNTSASKW
jgi:type IV secretion system protein VirB8